MGEYDPTGTVLKEYAYLGTRLIATRHRDPGTGFEYTTHLHPDALGSPVAATDETGLRLWTERYEPYGSRIRNEPGAQDNARWYTGHPEDPETGLVYAGARYYDPTIGRFLAVDPVSFTEKNLHSFNRYAYANNNPYKYVDPDGKSGVLLGPKPLLAPRPLVEAPSQKLALPPPPARLALPKPNPNGAPLSRHGTPLQRPGETLGEYGRRLEEGIGQKRDGSMGEIRQPALNRSAGRPEPPAAGGLRLADKFKDFIESLPTDELFGPAVGNLPSSSLERELQESFCGSVQCNI